MELNYTETNNLDKKINYPNKTYFGKKIRIDTKTFEKTLDKEKSISYENFIITCYNDLSELNKIEKLNELTIGTKSKKISEYNFNQYLFDIDELSEIDLEKHFFTQIELLSWMLINTTIARNGDLITRTYLHVVLPAIYDPKIEELLNCLKIPYGIRKIILYENLIDIFQEKNILQLDRLEELYIVNEKFNNELTNLPSSLKILLICAKEFNKPINLLPDCLKYLYINSYSFNKDLNCLPDELKVLSICSNNFSHTVDNLPLGLNVLHLNISTSIDCSFDYLPESINYLYLLSPYIKSNLSNLPIDLEVLYIKTNDLENTSIKRYNCLPSNIKQFLINIKN